MSISLSFFFPITSFKKFNSKNKFKPLRSTKLSCFKYFSSFRYFSFRSTQQNHFNFSILNKKLKISSNILNCSISILIHISLDYKCLLTKLTTNNVIPIVMLNKNSNFQFHKLLNNHFLFYDHH